MHKKETHSCLRGSLVVLFCYVDDQPIWSLNLLFYFIFIVYFLYFFCCFVHIWREGYMFTELGRDRRSVRFGRSHHHQLRRLWEKMVALLYSIDFQIIDRDLYVWFSINCFGFWAAKFLFQMTIWLARRDYLLTRIFILRIR